MSGKEAFILAMLSVAPLYGLTIVQASGGYISRGTVYWRMDALESNGYITSELDGMKDGRRVYTITEAGRAALLGLLGLP